MCYHVVLSNTGTFGRIYHGTMVTEDDDTEEDVLIKTVSSG